ncbi:MAG: hypothetical protein Q6373_001490 [Candidatus Sigynarchaeota archaeon]
MHRRAVLALLGIGLCFGIGFAGVTFDQDASRERMLDGGYTAAAQGSCDDAAPGNLIAIIVDAGVAADKGLNASISSFKAEWEYQFKKALPFRTIDASSPLGGFPNATAAAAVLNGSLLWWNASLILAEVADVPVPSVNRSAGSQDTLLAPWKNASIGTGWVMDAGCFDTMQRFTAYLAIVMNRHENWTGTGIHKMRFQMQLDAMGWMTPIPSAEAALKAFVSRQINCIELPSSPLNEIANISLPGFNNGWMASDISQRATFLAWLGNLFQLASSYHVRVFLATDEMVMTRPMYDWLNARLGYSGAEYGAEETKQFPDSIYAQATAPGSPTWTLLEAKYNATVEAIQSILNATNAAGFGGFKFRIDDISLKNWQGAEVYKKVSFMHTVATLGRFINITTAAAARVGAEVIQRMWMLGEEENPFNNATLCKQMLDPIQATNLILRTKETYNDHWLNMPANPTIGVSHHRWIIGWAVQYITPYYRSFLHDWYAENGTRYDYGNGTAVGWWENPNIVGYDGMLLTSAAWRTLATHLATQEATIFYLVQHTYNSSIRAADGVRAYLRKVGIVDPAVVQNISRVFELSTEAFRQLFFMKAWSASGKFRGDVVNGGSDLKYDPVRFNMFYRTLPGYGGMPGVDYTLQEGYNGSAIARQMADLCPSSYPGFGTLDNSPAYVFPAWSVDTSNLTSVLGYFREHMRAYAAFADLFAEWRAWHVAYYHWIYTWDVRCFEIAEHAREAIIAKHAAYQQKYTPKGWGFIYGAADLEGAWMSLVGRTNEARLDLLGVLVLIACLGIAGFFSFKRKEVPLKEIARAMLGMSRWKMVENRQVLFVEPEVNPLAWITGGIVVPAGVAISWALVFQALFAWQEPSLAMPFAVILGGYITGTRLGLVFSQVAGKKDWRSIHATGLALAWQYILLVVFAITFTIGGSINVILGTSSTGFYTLIVMLLACSALGIWSFMRNLVYTGKLHALATFWIIIGCVVACIFVAGLLAGGIENVIDAFLYRLEHLNG